MVMATSVKWSLSQDTLRFIQIHQSQLGNRSIFELPPFLLSCYTGLLVAPRETCLPSSLHIHREQYSARLQYKQGRKEIPVTTLENQRK